MDIEQYFSIEYSKTEKEKLQIKDIYDIQMHSLKSSVNYLKFIPVVRVLRSAGEIGTRYIKNNNTNYIGKLLKVRG